MNWTEITRTRSNNVWYIHEIKIFPSGHAERFLGSAIAHLQEKIIFTGSELMVAFWAVAANQPVQAAILSNHVDTTTTRVCAPQPSLHLPPQFPGIAHADRSSFSFQIDLDATQAQQCLNLHLEMADAHFHFASIYLHKRLSHEIAASELKMANQVPYLRQWANRKTQADDVASTCAHVINIAKAKTPAAVYAVLGDLLDNQKQFDYAIAAYRTAVQLQPQESKFEMRLSQLLQQHAPSQQSRPAIPKGISLSTSGDTALTIIVDMLYRSTPSYMYARELFQNELDAIYRRWDTEMASTGQSDFTGLIRIEPDAHDAKKLCFWGDGIGMTFDQVTEHLAKLVNSGNVAHTANTMGEPASPSNFGIGAKTSALPENTEGMVYRTLPHGESVGIEFALWKNPDTFLYEIKAWRNGDNIEHFRTIPVSDFVDAIQRRGSGACATLLGNSKDEDTFKKAENLLSRQIANEQIRKGIAYFLNSRYFTLPAAGLDVQVAERSHDASLTWQAIIGQKTYLDRYALQSGSLPIKAVGLAVTAYWWILSENAQQQGTAFNALGHVGLLWKNELYYNPNESQRAQRLQLNGFGIHFGEEQVVIYIEPCQPDLVDSHPSRTRLMHKQRELNPSDFGERFANNMPAELAAFQKSFFSTDTSGASMDKIRNNLAALGLHKGAKMRQYASSFINRGKLKVEPTNLISPEKTLAQPESTEAENISPPIPSSIWRNFDPETALFAAEWDSKGYVIKFNATWPQYQKTLASLIEETRAEYRNYPVDFLKKECQKHLRFEYFKIMIETLFSAYSMLEYSTWTDRMVESQLLSPAALSAVLQYNSNMRSSVKSALANSL
jgi:tetratricopeptide (TPR) repeat protein